MKLHIGRVSLLLASLLAVTFISTPYARAQQTLGGITGTVTDTSGAVVVNATVTAGRRSDQTDAAHKPRTRTESTFL